MKYLESAVLVSMAESVWNGSKNVMKVDIAVSERLKKELLKLLDKNVQNIFITDSDIRHIKKHHGANEALRGQIDIKPKDFAFIPLVMNEFDAVSLEKVDGLGNRALLFTKDIRQEGIIYLISFERGLRNEQIKTFWKTPSRVLDADRSPSKPTSETTPSGLI